MKYWHKHDKVRYSWLRRSLTVAMYRDRTYIVGKTSNNEQLPVKTSTIKLTFDLILKKTQNPFEKCSKTTTSMN